MKFDMEVFAKRNFKLQRMQVVIMCTILQGSLLSILFQQAWVFSSRSTISVVLKFIFQWSSRMHVAITRSYIGLLITIHTVGLKWICPPSEMIRSCLFNAFQHFPFCSSTLLWPCARKRMFAAEYACLLWYKHQPVEWLAQICNLFGWSYKKNDMGGSCGTYGGEE